MLGSLAALLALPGLVLGASGGAYAGAASLTRSPTTSNADVPALALRAYQFAESWAQGFAPTCKLSWSVLAGIGKIESNHGRHLGSAARFSPSGDVTPTILGPVLDGSAQNGTIHDTDGGRLDGDPVFDRAVGPMQFIPATWRSLGRDGNGDGTANPNNLFDAAVSAAGYLCLSGIATLAEPANLRRAVFAYNHSWAYVTAVLAWASFYLQHQGQGTLVQVQVPAGPSSLLGVGGAAAPAAAPTLGGRPGASSPPTTRGARTSPSPRSTSSTRPPTTSPPTTSRSTTSATTPKPPTTTEPCSGSDGHDSSCPSGSGSDGSGSSGSGSGGSGSGSSGSGSDGGGSSGGSGSGDGGGSSGSSGSGSGGSGDSGGS